MTLHERLLTLVVTIVLGSLIGLFIVLRVDKGPEVFWTVMLVLATVVGMLVLTAIIGSFFLFAQRSDNFGPVRSVDVLPQPTERGQKLLQASMGSAGPEGYDGGLAGRSVPSSRYNGESVSVGLGKSAGYAEFGSGFLD